MDIVNEAKRYLKCAFEFINNNQTIFADTIHIAHLNNFKEEHLISIMNYLESNNFIYDTFQPLGFKYVVRFKITGKGINWINDYNPNAQNVQNINFQNNYGSVGNNNTVTINNYFSFEQFDKLIDEHIPQNSIDGQEIQELRDKLKFLEENNMPATQGYLSKFSSLMQKHSWITGQVAGFLLRLVTHQ